jgi:hypothetical protein
MSYDSCIARHAMVAAEHDVRTALNGYSSNAESREQWVECKALWNAYVAWWLSHRAHWKQDPELPGRYRRLNSRQFGSLVRRVYPGIVRSKRCISKGVKRWGYRGLAGPRSRPPGKGGHPFTKPMRTTPNLGRGKWERVHAKPRKAANLDWRADATGE